MGDHEGYISGGRMEAREGKEMEADWAVWFMDGDGGFFLCGLVYGVRCAVLCCTALRCGVVLFRVWCALVSCLGIPRDGTQNGLRKPKKEMLGPRILFLSCPATERLS